MGFMVKNRELKSGDSGVVVPVGDTSNRPNPAVAGQLRYNTSNCRLEYYNGGQFIPVATHTSDSAEIWHGVSDGFTLDFGYLSTPIENADDVLVFVGQLYQPSSTYSVSGSGSLSFTEPPAAGVPITVIRVAGRISESVCESTSGSGDFDVPFGS